ncbi:alpha/beta fold hydrolase [Alicyclobacillus pomorum]|uniref:alpha/beta fold hydrolase n=1 Tax=Alicyclobacillus pomorum TaxID=204470 RepID=UPI000A043025
MAACFFLNHQLVQEFNGIALNNRGSERTDKPDIPYSIPILSQDAVELLRYLGIDRAHIIGISLGGCVATKLTLKHPDMVESLILVSTYVHRIEPILSSRRLSKFLRLFLIGKRLHGALRQHDAPRDHDAIESLHEIDVPTLIVHRRRISSLQIDLQIDFSRRGGHVLALRAMGLVDIVSSYLPKQA